MSAWTPAWALLSALAAPPDGSTSPSPPAADPPCDTAACGSLSLELKARGERQPLVEARVIVISAPPGAQPGVLDPAPALDPAGPPWQRAGTTDREGRITLDEVPKALVRVIVVAPGFERYEVVVQPAPGPKAQKLFVPTSDATTYRTVIETDDGPPRSAPQSQLLTREEIRTLPGSQGDALRALQNLPGVGRTPGNLGLLILRGAPPDQSRVIMGGHALPRAFHVLSLSSVFPAEVLDELRLVPGNFDAAYGNATGGVVVIEPRTPRRDGLHGFSEIDIAAASTMLEGPLGKGSFMVGGQRGYADLALVAADRVTERTTGQSSGVLRPTYYDYHAMFDVPLRTSVLTLRAFGAGDRLRTPGGADPEQSSGFDYRTAFHRFDAAVRTRHAGWRFWWTPSFRFESGRLDYGFNDSRQRRRDYVVSTRAELTKRLSRRSSFLVGTDSEVDVFAARTTGGGTGVFDRDDSLRGTETSTGFYASAQIDLGPVHLVPATRANAFTVRDQSAFSFDPRFVGHVDVAEAWTLDVGAGKYSQARDVASSRSIGLLDQGSSLGDGSVFLPPVFANFDPQVGFAPGNRQLTVRQAFHGSVGATWDPDEAHQISVTGFTRLQDNATPVFFDGETIGFSTHTRTYGLSAIARRRLTKKLYGWVAYTLMSSRLGFDELPAGSEVPDRPSDFDQRHNFNILASYVLPKEWRIGGRFRVVTGFPFTPVIGSVNFGGTSTPLTGRRNSGRLGTFHQLDIRVDKRWIRDRAIITGYVDIQNIYNRQNPEAVVYGPNFRSQEGFVGVPIFPTFGLRVDY